MSSWLRRGDCLRTGGLQTLGEEQQLMAFCRAPPWAVAGGAAGLRGLPGPGERSSGGRRPPGGAGGRCRGSVPAPRAGAAPGAPSRPERNAAPAPCRGTLCAGLGVCRLWGSAFFSLWSLTATAAREQEMTA